MKEQLKCPECGRLITEEEILEGVITDCCPKCGADLNIPQPLYDKFKKKTGDGKLQRPSDINTFGGRTDKPTISFKQLGILVLDGSGSMENMTKELISKADAVSQSVRDFFSRMKIGRMRNHFCFAVVDFDEKAYRKMDVTETAEIDATANYNPRHDGELTYLHKALDEAGKIVDDFMKKDKDRIGSVVVIIMTDGLDMDMPKAKDAADRLKKKYGEKIKITASCFSSIDLSRSDKTKVMAFLRSIVSREDFCTETTSTEELRGFFEHSVSR